MSDMCLVEFGNERLLIVIPSAEDDPVLAYNSTTGNLVWSKEKKLPNKRTFESSGATGDGKNHLLICDDRSIEMFSVSDGQYLGCFMKKDELGLGIVTRVRLHEATSSLVVAHQEAAKISVIN